MENWVASETIELLTDEPYIGSPEMIEGHEKEWEGRNKKSLGFLYARPDGGLLPRKEDNSQKLSGLFRILPQMVDDEKALANIFNAARGEASNETSGRAINARADQSNKTNFAFTDNGIIAPSEYIGMQFIDLFPKVYDYEKTLKIIGEDDRENGEVTINKSSPVMGEGGIEAGTLHEFKDKKGIVKKLYADLKKARFNVTVDVGPGMKTQRMEAVDSMIRMSQGNPVFAEASSPQVAKMLDYQDADKIAERCEFIMNIKYPGIENVGADNDPTSPQAKTQAAIKQAVEQVQQQSVQAFQAAEAKIQEQEAEKQRLEQEKLAIEQENQKLKMQVDMAESAMKDAAVKQEIQEQEYDLQVREIKMESEHELFKAQAEKELLRVEAAKNAQNDVAAKAIAELQAQIDSMKAERTSMMAEIMGAIDKDSTEKEHGQA
jgi:hypothetical protein